MRRLTWALTALALVAAAAWSVRGLLVKRAGRLRVGVSLPLSGAKKQSGERILEAIRLAAEQRNAAGGAGGRRIELVVKDDANDPALGEANARAFAADPEVAAVIGHYDAPVAIKAREVYDRAGLVVYSPSVSDPEFTGGSRWAFSGNFSDDEQAETLAAYVSSVKQHHQVAVFHGDDPYGTRLVTTFSAKARRIGLDHRVFAYAEADAPLAGDYAASRLGDGKWPTPPDAVVLLSHSVKGAELIHQLRAAGFTGSIYGSDRISTDLLARLGNDTEHLHVSFPFMYDFASLRTLEFTRDYRARFHHEPTVFAAFAYDGLSLIAAAAAAAGGPDRERIREHLSSIDADERAVEGASGSLMFERGRNLHRDVVMSTARSGEFHPALVQLRRVTSRHALKSLPDLVARGGVLVADGVPFYRISVVYVGLDLLRVSNVNLLTQSFDAEYVLWFKWKDDDVDLDNIALLNEVDGESAQRTPLRRNFPVEHPGDREPELRWASFKVKGSYTERYDLKDFPFDTQRLSLSFAHRSRNANKLQLVADREAESAESLREHPLEWRVMGREDFAGTFNYHSTFGNPSYKKGETQADFSMVQTDLVVKRVLFPYLITLFLPLFILIAISLTVLLVPMQDFYSRSGLVLTSLLGILVEHMTQARSMPQVGYLLKADYFYVLSYVLLFILVSGVIVVNLHFTREQVGPAMRWDRRLAVACMAGALVIYGALGFWSLRS